ncbi:hypothetical protein COLO4_08450 [Corchorus olitorius]|uniref:GBF-interacting protein 1 N-terminal domain-containing protein n=1 Tax=Corchorus olitorius TaxID=93759 RepID=A0A1R3KFS0_9ROSI|nr:hypothetical protein COLO4_08450 [Corchorus olitorius]
MDPNDAVQRLLSQDTFHEVKSRRERRKEMKDTQEPKTRSNYGPSNRGVRGSSEHSFGRSGSVHMNSNELGKAAYRKVNGNSFNADNRRQTLGTGEMIDSSLQQSHGSQSAWVGASGHATMADIVKMGRPQSKGSQMPCETSYTPQDAVPPNTAVYLMKNSHASSPSESGTHHDLHSSDLDMSREFGKKSSQHEFDNGWHTIEPITTSDIGETMYSDQSYLQNNRPNLSSNCWSENATGGLVGTRKQDDDLCKNTGSPDSYQQIYEHQEGIGRGSHISVPNSTASLSNDVVEAVSSAAVNLQNLSLGKEEPDVTRTEENHGVVLPNYLQAFAADCSHLSFGTYKSGKSTASSHPRASSSLTNDPGDVFTASNGPSSMHLSSRNSLYHDREYMGFDFDALRATADARNYNAPKSSQAELRKVDVPHAAANGNDFVSQSSITDSRVKNIQELCASMPFMINPKARNLPPLPSEVQSYSNSTTSDIVAEALQSLKARDSAAFPASQSISSRYGSTASSIKNLTVSMPEVLNSGAFSASLPTSQALNGTNLTTGPLKDNFSAHSYSQTGYSAIPQGHTYPPSVFQQAYPDGNVYEKPAYPDGNVYESLAGMKYNLPQYRSASMTSLPLPGSYASGYDSLGNPTDIPGNFQHNLSTGTAGNKVGYDDLLRSQYRDGGANFALLQQSQQQSQLYGALNYPGVYNSQAGITREQQLQQQNLRDMLINGSQGPSSKQQQLPQLWQQSY